MIWCTTCRTRFTSRWRDSSSWRGLVRTSPSTNTKRRPHVTPARPASNEAMRLNPEASYKPVLLTLALFIGLAILHTWPLATAPGTLSRNDNGDFILHEWIMAWVAHQIVTNPLHLFDANIFYPERYTLAYSDHLFVQSMMGAPLLWAGASP